MNTGCSCRSRNRWSAMSRRGIHIDRRGVMPDDRRVPQQRTVACPACATSRVTKAAGRQRLACRSCGRTFLVRDAAEPAPPEGSPPAAQSATAQSTAPPAGAEAIGAVEVLEPARLSISRPRLAPPVAAAGDDASLELGPTPPVAQDLGDGEVPVLEPDPEPERDISPAPVVAGPGRRVGYYGRVGRRG